MIKKVNFEIDKDSGQWVGIAEGDPDIIVHLCNFCSTPACDCRDYPGPCILCEHFKEIPPARSSKAHDLFALEAGFH